MVCLQVLRVYLIQPTHPVDSAWKGITPLQRRGGYAALMAVHGPSSDNVRVVSCMFTQLVHLLLTSHLNHKELVSASQFSLLQSF